MPPYVLIEKAVGETPLQALERFRATDPNFFDVPMTYAGRLDPMASGQLLILIGEECKQREKYDGLDKTYEFEILLGIGSDTGDILGLASEPTCIDIPTHSASDAVEALAGTHSLPYPAYSSKTVDGKPLFEYARGGAAAEAPLRQMTVKRVEYRGMARLSNEQLLENILNKLARLHVPESSDFRVEAVAERWKEVLAAPATFTIASATAEVGSGTYIRSLAPYLAEKLDTAGLAYSIHRTKILL